MTELKKVLMERDELTESEADDIISDMIIDVANGENPEEILWDHGLEPDYIFDILP